MEDGVKRFKKGEILLTENKPSDSVYLIQSGKVSLFIKRSGKKLELEQLGPGHICGEQALIVPGSKMPFDAEATSEVKAMVVPVELYKGILEKANPGIRLLLKSLFEVSKQNRQTVKNVKMDADASPLPQNQIPKFFCMLNLIAKQVGTHGPNGEITLSWGTLKIFVTRMFLDMHSRMLHVLNILKKLDYVDLKYEKNDDGDEELIQIIIKNPSVIEEFAEFYQYNYFKGSTAEIIYLDAMAVKTTRIIINCIKDLEADRRGLVMFPYNTLADTAKKIFKLELKPLQFDNLEKKGLFVKRQTNDATGEAMISIDKIEFTRVYNFWKIIDQIDQLNEKGVVDFSTPAEEPINNSSNGGCVNCGTELLPDANFCMNCGTKVAKAA